MDMSEVKAFNLELSGLYDNKPPISKAKMSAITKGAIKAIKFYKHVVHSVEKFIQKCKPEYKVPGLYVIDSIVRQSRHQFGQDKDVFAPRFAKNMQQTFANLFRCPPQDKRNIIRVLNLWQKNHVFGSEVIQPLLDMADPNHPLHQEIQQQQNNNTNGSTLSLGHNTSDKISPVPPPQHTPHVATPLGDQFQDQPSGGSSGVKFNRKLLNDFEYDSEDEAGGSAHEPTHHAHSSHNTHAPHSTQPQNAADALGSILTNPEIMRQLQSLQAQMQLMTGMQIPNLMPMMSDMQLQQNQNQNLPFLNSQDQQKQGDSKDDMANESDIEFVDAGPQVIEIPDANDSRSPSPKSRRHRSRSKSPKRRRRSRSRSRSPRRRRDRDRDKDREKSYKEREAEKEKQREREKKGLPPIKKDNLSVCSTTLWVGHLSKLATQEELSDLFGSIGGVVSIDVVAPRGCAFVVMERRRDAAKALTKLNKHKLHSKEITVAWAPGKGVKGREWKDHWEAELGVSYLPWGALHARWALGALSLDALEDGGAVDEDTLPPWLPPRIIPKSMMDGLNMLGMPPVSGPGLLPPGAIPTLGSLPPGALPPAGMPPGNLQLPPGLPTPPNSIPMPGMPPPGMPTGIPPGLTAGLPPGIRPPNLPTGIPGLQGDAGLPPAGALLGFPPGVPPQSLPQPGMVGGFLSGLLGVGGLVAGMPLQLPHAHPNPLQQQQHHQQPQRPTEVTRTDDAMDLDNEDAHAEESGTDRTESTVPTQPPPALLPDQIQALLLKPPPNFNSSEPPPNFNASEPPPFNQPPPDEKQDDDKKKDADRDRDRRDRDRDRDRRDRDRRDRDRRDRDRGRDRDSNRERDERRDRDRDRGRDRGDRRDRDRDRDRDRFSSRDNNNGERSREKSPRNNISNQDPNEKSLQERLWEMANGKPAAENKREEFVEGDRGRDREGREPLLPAPQDRGPPRCEVPPAMMDAEIEEKQPEDGGWTQIPPPRMPPQQMAPPIFRAELRMRGPPRQPMRGPWMDGPGPRPFGPRFNGNGPPFNRPPFERPPFEGGPIFDGPSRFERPPFNRMPFEPGHPPFDGPRPPFDGPRPPFDGPRPPFDGPRPPFDGPRPPFDGPRPPFDGPRPPFDGPRPPFDGSRPPFDGPRPPFDVRQFDDFDGDRQFDGPPRFEGPPEFFDRNRRFDDREQFNDRWNGDRDREWDRRNEWDDRRRDRRSRDHEDRFRDRNDRRRNFEERSRTNERNERTDRNERNPKRERDRKSRWGAPEDTTEQNEPIENEPSNEAENALSENIESSHEERNDVCEQSEVQQNENETPGDVSYESNYDSQPEENTEKAEENAPESANLAELYDASDAVDTSFSNPPAVEFEYGTRNNIESDIESTKNTIDPEYESTKSCTEPEYIKTSNNIETECEPQVQDISEDIFSEEIRDDNLPKGDSLPREENIREANIEKENTKEEDRAENIESEGAA